MPALFLPPAWGSSPYGSITWGGSLAAATGGTHIPAYAPFDLYNVQPGGDMDVFASYVEVQPHAADGQLGNDPDSGDFEMESGGILPATTARVVINTLVPDLFTFEITVRFTHLPSDFSNLASKHALVSVSDQQGATFGLLFSQVGISYTGSVVFDAGGNLVLNSPVQLLPNSLGMIDEGTFYTIRVAVDSNTKTTFIYVTETVLLPSIGHQLKYILPAFLSSASVIPPVDTTVLSVKGTVGSPVLMQIDEIGLGTGLLIPNLPPVADAGRDQAVRACSIVRLDGRTSFDPEGAPLLYKWRLIDGPDTSSFVYPGHDGITFGTTLTNKFYSATLAALVPTVGIVAGDVVLVQGVPYNILTTGTDGGGFYVQIDGFDLLGGLTSTNFKLLKQRALSNTASAQPSFFPDVSGIYRFDLIVFDGGLFSLPSALLINVTESPVPRGITPDVSFLWGYLSDFWKLVDNTDVIQTFWGALAQLAASELLTLWQHDYSKSLRDIQRTFQRRWLHYDLYVREPFPELTKVSTIYGGVESLDLPPAGVAAAGLSGTITVTSPLFPDFPLFLQPNTTFVAVEDVRKQLERQLKGLDARFSVTAYINLAGTAERILVTAPFPFSFSATTCSSCPFALGANHLPTGTLGAAIGLNTYLVERRLDLAGVQQGDYLVVDGIAYEIARVITGKADPWAGQRIVTSDPLPSVLGRNWTVARGVKSSFLDFYDALCSKDDTALFEVIDLTTQLIAAVPVPVLSAAADNNSSLLVDTGVLAPFLAQPTLYSVYFQSVYRRTYMPVDPLVIDVPTLQEKIKNTDDTAVLRQNIDFFRETYRGQPCLRFVTSTDTSQPDVWGYGLPAQRMWAETSYIDNRPTIEGNFGIAAEFTLDDLASLPSTTDYLSIIRGLWYAYFNGPTLYNLRAGTQILLGLPFAEEAGTIVEIRNDFSASSGRILVQDLNAQEIVRSYSYPAVLQLEVNPTTKLPYAVGDTVAQFAPLVTGAEIVDYIKDPSWFQGYLNQGVFLEVEKFFKFLVRIDSSAFSLDTLVFVQSFIKRIKPTYTYPLFVILKKLDDGTTVNTNDVLQLHGGLHLNEWISSWNIDVGPYGHLGGAFEDARSAWGGWRGKFDGDNYDGPSPGLAATYPTPISPSHWGYDREYLAPTDVIYGTMSTTFGAPAHITFDGIFAFDLATFTSIYGIFSGTLLIVPAVPPHTVELPLGPTVTSPATGHVNTGLFQFESPYPLKNDLHLALHLYINGVSLTTIGVVIPAGLRAYISSVALNNDLTTGDVLGITVTTITADTPLPAGGRFFFAMGNGTTWTFDETAGSGTYRKTRLM